MLEEKGSAYLFPFLFAFLGASLLSLQANFNCSLLYFFAACFFIASYLWSFKGLFFSAFCALLFLLWKQPEGLLKGPSVVFFLISINAAFLSVLLQRRAFDLWENWKEKVSDLEVELDQKTSRLQEETLTLHLLEEKYEDLFCQYSEKIQALSQVKEELFFVDHQLQAFEKESLQSSLEEDSSQSSLIDSLRESNQTCEALEKEVLLLEEIVSDLSKPKVKVSRQKKVKKDPEQSFLDFLME